MAMNGVIVYFPWGAGGNLIRNIITLDTRFEFLDDQEFGGTYVTVEERYNWLNSYYRTAITPDTWLRREWSIRQKLYNRYYRGTIQYWNPNYLVAYDCHGEEQEIDNIKSNNNLSSFDQFKPVLTSPWCIQQCRHVFLIPRNIKTATDIYISKNPVLNQFDYLEKFDQRVQKAQDKNNKLTENLIDLQSILSDTLCYTSDDLYTNANVPIDIAKQLQLNVPQEYIIELHSNWLQSTREVYYNYYEKELLI